MGVVTALQTKKGKGFPMEAVPALELHAGDRITVMDRTVREYIRKNPEEGLCYRKFDANLIADFCGAVPVPGIFLRAGGMLLEITDGKECFPECTRIRMKKACPLCKGACFAKIRSGGLLKPGMEITVLPENPLA